MDKAAIVAVAALPILGYTINPDQPTRRDRTSVIRGSLGSMEAVVDIESNMPPWHIGSNLLA